MTKIISHRGNIEGINVGTENTIHQIVKAISVGLDVEIDIRWHNGPCLGHDSPKEPISLEFLERYSEKLWIHCKDRKSLELLTTQKSLNLFYHENDPYVLTSKGFIWVHYLAEPIANGITVALTKERTIDLMSQNLYGICTDFCNIHL